MTLLREWVYVLRYPIYTVGCVAVAVTAPEDNTFGSIMAIVAITAAAFVMVAAQKRRDDK